MCNALDKAAKQNLRCTSFPWPVERFPAIFTCGIVTGERSRARNGMLVNTHCGEAESQSLRGCSAAQRATMSKPKSLNANASTLHKQTALCHRGGGHGPKCRNKDVADEEGSILHLIASTIRGRSLCLKKKLNKKKTCPDKVETTAPPTKTQTQFYCGVQMEKRQKKVLKLP